MTAADEARAYLVPATTPALFGRALVEQLLAEHDAAVAELDQLRAERDGRIAQAFASGWCDALTAYRSPGWAEREAAWRKYREAVRADDASERSSHEGSNP